MQKRIKYKVHLKSGDTVKILAGDDKGKVGEVIKVFPKSSKILVKDINIKIKHCRPKQQGDNGTVIRIESPIHSSNAMLYSEENQIASRYKQIIKNNSKQRILQKTGEIIN